jgi:DUF1680 family protein
MTAAAAATTRAATDEKPLAEFGYSDVKLAPGLAQTQFEQTRAVLLGLNEDSLLKPWRLRAGLAAPGPDMGGWYDELPLDKTESGGHGFAPAHCFGQWISALARGYAADHDARTKAKLEKILALYEPAISGKFYKNFRFPAYNYDKLVIGLIDAQYIAGLPQAGRLLTLTTDAAEPYLPPYALDRDEPQRKWRASVGENTSDDYTWDESYTGAENLYLAYQRGAGERYKILARRFLLDKTYFDPLSEGKNVLDNHHAYSFCNALSSAMQAYLVDGSEKHLRAASNAFDMITQTQSFATGAWGPNESFVAEGSDDLFKSLSDTHRGFETPCGSYAHFKLTRYLLRVKKDGRYGDSMERVLYNTVLGAKPLQADGRAFYYSDYHFGGAKTYFPDKWPCCAGTLPQVAADYRILIYFRDERGLYVNLYLPSEVNWVSADGAQVKLSQAGDYPAGDLVTMRMDCSRASKFAVRLRIPGWARASVRVNGAAVPVRAEAGFAAIDRRWKSGDKIELRLGSTQRFEAIDARHPETVAVVKGPLVMFAIGKEPVTVRRGEPLPGTFKPFTEIEDENYSAYVTLG